jgi:hypothetical protein
MNAVYSSVPSICSTQFLRSYERDSKRSIYQAFPRLRIEKYMLALQMVKCEIPFSSRNVENNAADQDFLPTTKSVSL